MKAGGSDGADIRNAEVGLWFKTSLPFSCLIFGLVGAPLGMRSPALGKNPRLGLGVPIVMGYYVIYMIMSNLAQGGGISAGAGGVAAEHLRVRRRVGADLESGEIRWAIE